jgi:uncharacterized MAPEG superfamily protein
MLDLILITALFYLIQLMTPMLLSIGKVPVMNFLSTKGGSLDLSDASKRALVAVHNFRESLPIFLVLAVLSIQLEVENEQLAEFWLITSRLYLVLGIANVYSYPFIRTGVFFVSIMFLVRMARNLLVA